MGNCVGGFRKRRRTLQHRKKVRKIRICILGLDGAGKSTVTRALASADINDVLPTNGFTLQEFKYRKAEVIAYDLGGSERIRSIWKNYYPEVFGVIYVVDGSEPIRLSESGKLLKDVLRDENIRDKPLLVILNKTDRQGCIDEIQLTDRFHLHGLANLYRSQIRVEVCQSNAGTGKMIDPALNDGFEWLLERIYDDYERLEKKVNEALQKLKQRQDEERMRRKHWLAATVSRSQRCKRWMPCYNMFSSSTSSDERSSIDGNATKSTEQQQVAQNASTSIPAVASTQPDTNHETKSEHQNEIKTQRRHSRNAISPIDYSSIQSMDSGKLKYPEIFQVGVQPTPISLPLEGLQQPEESSGSKLEARTTINGNLRPVRKPVQLIPLSVIPHR